jgi:hypothetical protein
VLFFSFCSKSCQGHLTQYKNWMLEIFGMWIPYIENHMPTKIHAYPNHNMEAYLVGQNFIACELVKFTENTVGTVLFWETIWACF